MSTLLKNFIQNRSPARNLHQNQLLHCKCLHNTDHVCFTIHDVKRYKKKIINTVLELSCEYLLCPKPKIQLQRVGINLPQSICSGFVFFFSPGCLSCYCIFFLTG